MKKLVPKHENENIVKPWESQNLGCNFVVENESRCADFTTRVVRDQNEVAKLDKTSDEKLVQK